MFELKWDRFLVSDCKVAGAGGRSLWVRSSKRDEAFETCLDTSSEAKAEVTGGRRRRRQCRRRVKMMMIRQRG